MSVWGFLSSVIVNAPSVCLSQRRLRGFPWRMATIPRTKTTVPGTAATHRWAAKSNRLTPEGWHIGFDLHVHAIFHLWRAAIPAMRRKNMDMRKT